MRILWTERTVYLEVRNQSMKEFVDFYFKDR